MSLHMDILANKLTDQQKRFCDEYLVSFNAYRAALSAGYSENTASKAELLHIPKIQEYLKAKMGQTAERLEITHDMILREFAKIAFSNMGNYYDDRGILKPMCELSESEKAAISYYQIMDAVDGEGYRVGELHKIKLHNKMAALDKIARHLGFYGEKKQEVRTVKQEVFAESRTTDEKEITAEFSDLEQPHGDLLAVDMEEPFIAPVHIEEPTMPVLEVVPAVMNRAPETVKKNLTIPPLMKESRYQNLESRNEKKRVVSFDRGSYTFKKSGREVELNDLVVS